MLLLTKKPRLFLFADMISQSVAPNCPSICRPLAETLHLAFSPHPRRHNNAHLRWSLWSINHKRNFGAGLVLSQTRLFRWKKLQHPSLANHGVHRENRSGVGLHSRAKGWQDITQVPRKVHDGSGQTSRTECHLSP